MHTEPPSTGFPPHSLGAVSQLSAVRARFVDWLREQDVEPERVDDLSVVLSELGANAIRGTPAGAPSPDVRAEIIDGVLRLVVTNVVASDAPVADDWDLSDPLRTGGRGLLLVSAFVDEVDIDVVDRRLVVTCTASI